MLATEELHPLPFRVLKLKQQPPIYLFCNLVQSHKMTVLSPGLDEMSQILNFIKCCLKRM